jgi:ABC-type lipoprotein release transport system permease subunit
MERLTAITTLIAEVGVLLGVIIPVIVSVRKISNGTRCQLRSEMLRIYYHNQKTETIRQYELENFLMLYEAYKCLKGNSFIDQIKKEVTTWKVVA